MAGDNKLPVYSIYYPPVVEQRTPIGGIRKRIFDIAAASFIVVTIAPLLALIALAVKLADGGKVLYYHPRVGHNGRAFLCYKFRTMIADSDHWLAAYLESNPAARAEWLSSRKLRRDERVTGIGRILRKLSLDELPQLFNVIRGDMSLVGPRPIVAEEIDLYGEHSEYYFRSRPGITGAWQASGRSDISYDQRVKIDRHYVEHWTFSRDLLIILKTVPAVLAARGSC